MRAKRAERRSWPSLAAAAALVLAQGAALPAQAADPRVRDPLERVNRASHAFNDLLDRMLARPAARAYRTAVPVPVRQAIANFTENLTYPTVIINNALQGKFKDAASDTARFMVNSVVGIGGFGDPATGFGLRAHNEDFGQTLGRWGVPPGPYLVIPLLGPSDFRDGSGRFVDRFSSIPHYASIKVEYGFSAVELLGRRTELLATDATLQEAFDPYALVRNAYLVRREYLVRDGNMPEEDYEEQPADPPAH